MRRTTAEIKTEFETKGIVAIVTDAVAMGQNCVDTVQAYDRQAALIIGALGGAGFEIVRKSQPGSTAVDRVEFARRTGCWDGVSDRDYVDWLRSLVPPGFVLGTVTELAADGEGAIARFQSMTLVPGNTVDLPPGTEIRTANTEAPKPERDYLGLRENGADDLAARYGCRVTLAGMDDADMPLTDEPDIGDPHYVVVTDRSTGRHVALVEAWETEDGDPLVPMSWLETVLSAWDAARDPEPRAA